MLQWIFEKLLDRSINHDKFKLYNFLSRFNKPMTIWEKKLQIEIDAINRLIPEIPDDWIQKLDYQLENKIKEYEQKNRHQASPKAPDTCFL